MMLYSYVGIYLIMLFQLAQYHHVASICIRLSCLECAYLPTLFQLSLNQDLARRFVTWHKFWNLFRGKGIYMCMCFQNLIV